MWNLVNKWRFADVLQALADNDGACLYWQMPDSARAKAALDAGAITMVDDLLVHPKAITIEAGMAYTMPKRGMPRSLLLACYLLLCIL